MTGPPPRWTQAEWDEATLVLWQRAQDRCEHCGKPLRGRMSRHHRQRRAVGGDRYANLLVLLPACHGDIHASPASSRDNGWIVSAFVDDPADIPVLLWGGRTVRLDDDGNAVVVHMPND